MSQYLGTCNLTNGDATVTGVGTAFLSEVEAGDSFIRVDEGIVYDIASITSDTALELSTSYSGATASGVNFVIARDFTPSQNYPELERGSLETAAIFTRALRDIDEDVAARELASNLGTSAYEDVMSSPTDTTAGRLMPVGAGGLLADRGVSFSDYGPNIPAQIARYRADQINDSGPENLSYSHSAFIGKGVTGKSALAIRETGNDAAQAAWLGSNSDSNAAMVWSRIYTNRDILGTVSQSGGVPTGAVIEYISNANGKAVRLADGTQYAWNDNSAITTNPATFVGTPTSVDGDKFRIGKWY